MNLQVLRDVYDFEKVIKLNGWMDSSFLERIYSKIIFTKDLDALANFSFKAYPHGTSDFLHIFLPYNLDNYEKAVRTIKSVWMAVYYMKVHFSPELHRNQIYSIYDENVDRLADEFTQNILLPLSFCVPKLKELNASFRELSIFLKINQKTLQKSMLNR